MLKAEHISRRLDRQFSLDDISFEIASGKITCILGESGSGKTTLLRIIAGFEKVDHGRLLFNETVLNSTHHQVAPEKRNFGLVFQEYALFPHFTAEKNILFGAKRKETVLSLIEKTGLRGLEKKYPHELSGGQQQRIALARTLASEPRLILMDEPFSNLDHSLRSEMREQLRHLLKQTGIPCILVTHDIDDVLSLADHTIILQNGKILQTGSPEDVYKNPVDEYTAKLFGKINIFTPEELQKVFGIQSEKPMMIRPDKIEITASDSGNCKVEEMRFMGAYVDMLVSCQATKFHVHGKSEADFTKLASVKTDPSHLIPLNYAK